MSKLTWTEALKASPGPRSLKEYGALFSKGVCMGVADLIPGVSGGTVAFITGIYEQLLDAIGSINKSFLQELKKGQIKQALALVHVRFLAVVLGAIITTIFAFARVMHYLMTEHTVWTWSLFFGLIGASIVVVFRELTAPFSWRQMLPLIGGTIAAYIIVSLIPVDTPETAWFLYLCGLISISAMILPGLSGSFLLLILGKYEFVTAAVKNPFAPGAFEILVLFVLGALTGAMGFTRILNWFLKHYRPETMAFLTGILVGSMKKVWPWKEVLETRLVGGKERVLREANILPELSQDTAIAVVLMVLGLVFVLVLDRLSQGKNQG